MATRTPQAATTSAAAVEMLKVPERSPPVPQVSKTSSAGVRKRHRLRAHRPREARPAPRAARPSSTSPISSPAICAGAASPRMITAMRLAASSVVRSSRRPSFSISALNIATARESSAECGDLRGSGSTRDETARRAVGQRRCRSPMTRPSSFDRALTSSAVRPPLFGDDQRVIARRLKRAGDAGEHAAAVVLDRRGLAVHRHAARARPRRQTPCPSPDVRGRRPASAADRRIRGSRRA